MHSLRLKTIITTIIKMTIMMKKVKSPRKPSSKGRNVKNASSKLSKKLARLS